MNKESIGEKARREVPNKTLGIVFILLAILVLAIGVIAHVQQTAVFCIQSNEVIYNQLDFYFIENIFIGFFSGIFLLLGIYYLRLKQPTENV